MDCTAIYSISLELGAGFGAGAGTSGREEHAVTSDCMEGNKRVDSESKSKSGYRGRNGSLSCIGVELRVGVREGVGNWEKLSDQSHSTMGNNVVKETVEPSPGSPADISILSGWNVVLTGTGKLCFCNMCVVK